MKSQKHCSELSSFWQMVEQDNFFFPLEDRNAICKSTENHVALAAKLQNLLF